MNRSFSPSFSASHQQGYILLIALVFLVSITSMAIFVVQSNTGQEVMARGYRDLGIAFHQTERLVKENEGTIDLNNEEFWNNCETLDSEVWAGTQNEATVRVDRIDLCDGSSSITMGRSITQEVDQKFRVVGVDFEDGARRNSRVVIETIFIP